MSLKLHFDRLYMKITNVIQCTDLGGMEKATLRLLQCLKELGVQSKILSLNKIGRLEGQLNEAGIPYSGIGYAGPWGILTAIRLRKILRQEDDGDVLLMTGHHLASALLLPKKAFRKRLLSIHFHHQGEKSILFWRLLYVIALWKFDRIYFASDYIRAEAEKIAPFIRSKSSTLHNPLTIPAITMDEARNLAKTRLGLDPRKPVMGNAGWLISRKRFDVFLKVAAKVIKSFPGLQIAVAGDGELREKLEALARELEIEDKVVWLGWLDDMDAFYESIDVLVFNSDFDAFPTTPLEAMAHGCHVVASLENGGLKEVIGDATTGYLLESHDIDLLAKEVVACLSGERDERVKAGRERVSEICDKDRVVQQFMEWAAG